MQAGQNTGVRELSHAYIICGSDEAERWRQAERMAAGYVCTGAGEKPCGVCSGCRKAAAGIHPDIIRAGLDAAINVAQVRALRSDAYIRPNEAPGKVYILDRARDMNPSAQNALLKVLEDGPAYAAFLLLTDNEASLLPTVRSRCEVLRLQPGKRREPSEPQLLEQAETLAGLLSGGAELELCAFAVTLEKCERAQFAALLEQTLECLRDRLVRPENAEERRSLLKAAEQLKTVRRACDFNTGIGHLAGWLAAGAREL